MVSAMQARQIPSGKPKSKLKRASPGPDHASFQTSTSGRIHPRQTSGARHVADHAPLWRARAGCRRQRSGDDHVGVPIPARCRCPGPRRPAESRDGWSRPTCRREYFGPPGYSSHALTSQDSRAHAADGSGTHHCQWARDINDVQACAAAVSRWRWPPCRSCRRSPRPDGVGHRARPNRPPRCSRHR